MSPSIQQITIFFLFWTVSSNVQAQCTDWAGFGTNQGSLTFDGNPAAYQTTGTVTEQDYWTFSVSCGSTYNFDFCANGGSPGSLYPDFTILDGVSVLASSLNAGSCGSITWTSDYSGTATLYITDNWDGCASAANYTAVAMAYNETGGGSDPSFTLTAACGGGFASVTGTTGGVFSWDPDPGDGAQVNSSSGLVTNGSVGTTYYVEYTICGASSTESVTVVEDDCFTLNGDAGYITIFGEQCIQLTGEVNDETGCAWNSSLIDFDTDFSLTLDYYFGNNIGGADGTTFSFQPSSSTACGQAGAQLAGGGIANSLVIEFDTYDNDGGASWDLSCDHIAVEVDGDLIDDPANFPSNSAPLCGPACAKPGGGNIDDGGTYEVEIAWDASTQTLSVYFNGSLRLTCNYDFVTNVFGGENEVYWGATAATGGLNNQQYFCPSTVVVLPVELSSFESDCDNSTEVFNWTTDSENNVKEFVLEYTYDGLLFYPERVVEAHGTTSIQQHYSTSVFASDSKTRYYRLKVVDYDQNVEYSGLIASQQCNIGQHLLISSASILDNELIIALKDKSDLMILDQMGRMIESFHEVQSVQVDVSSYAQGIYLLKARSIQGVQESLKISTIGN